MRCAPSRDLQKELLKVLAEVEAAPGVQINTGAAGAGTGGVAVMPDFTSTDADAAEVRFPDRRVRDEGAYYTC